MDPVPSPPSASAHSFPTLWQPETRLRRHCRQDFACSTLRNVTERRRKLAKRCRRCSSWGRSSGRTCLSSRSSGTRIIVLNASNLLSRPVVKKPRLDYVDLYLIHTPFAFQPGDEQDPRDASGNVIYDKGITLVDTWRGAGGLGRRGQVQGHRVIRCQPGPDEGNI